MSFSLIFKNMKNYMLFLLAALMLALLQVEAVSPTKQEDANRATSTPGNWTVFADALGLYASEESSAVWADLLTVGDNTSAFAVPDVNFNWDPGFRLGAGYNLEHDQWDTQLYWTWFRTEAHQSKGPSSGKGLVVQEIHPEFFAADLSKEVSQSAKIRWGILFNMFDWELGRSYWISKALSFRPFIGVKGGWINQSIHVQYNNLIINSSPAKISAKEEVKNHFWGVGPVGGVDTKWKLRDFRTHFPSLFGDFSAATLFGTWLCSDVYNDTTGEKVIVNMRRLTLGALMLRGFMGIGWDVDFNKGRSHFTTRLGYEMQLWVNQLRVPTSQLICLHGDLTLQGVTFNCGFDF